MHELPRVVILIDEAFTVENELLTPTGKFCRRKIYQKFEKQIQQSIQGIDMNKADPIVALGIDKTLVPKSIKQLINAVLERDENAKFDIGDPSSHLFFWIVIDTFRFAADDFVSLGGDSLAAAKVFLQL